ncbi:MAG: phosphatidate cytidylyltransferase, partial [Desulfobulbaceae bacterium]|nr:phosphatidate cytidylyltransferase [Desulfobulbaceae bacterium]
MIRLITGLLVCGGWLALVLFGAFPLFWLVVSALGVLALHEYGTVVLSELSPAARLGAMGCGFLPFLAAFGGNAEAVTAALPLALIILVGYIVSRYRDLSDPFLLMSRTGLGILYVGFCGAHLILLRHQPAGVAWLLWLTGITVGSDSLAYYAGRLFGKRKLCPAVSPGKTVVGFVGGLVGSVAVSVLLARFLFIDHDPLVMGLAAALLSCVGVLGDLCESVIKRAMAVKDSGSILPGHGGILDRIDSLLFTAPVLYTLVR